MGSTAHFNRHRKSFSTGGYSSSQLQQYDSQMNNQNNSYKYSSNMAEETSAQLANFTVEMHRAKPKILKNLSSLYSVFMPSKSASKKPSSGGLV